MSDPRKAVTDTELRILEELWAGDATIRSLCDTLYPDGGAAQYATVQKLLDRLEEKGFVRRDRSGRAHRFLAVVDRDAFLGSRLAQLSERLCDGSFVPLLSQLVRARALDAEERAELRRLLEELPDGDPPGADAVGPRGPDDDAAPDDGADA